MPTPDDNALSHLPDSGDPDRGEGALLTSKDANLIRRSFKERWPISEDQRTRAVAAILYTIEESEDDRARAAAFKALVEADKLNHAAETGTGMGGDVTVRVVYDSPKPSQ
jgi:hypothetical protein